MYFIKLAYRITFYDFFFFKFVKKMQNIIERTISYKKWIWFFNFPSI